MHRQDFGAKFNLSYHNDTPIADSLKHTQIFSYYGSKLLKTVDKY